MNREQLAHLIQDEVGRCMIIEAHAAEMGEELAAMGLQAAREFLVQAGREVEPLLEKAKP